MTGADVKQIRSLLSNATGRRLSTSDLGIALGLAPKNAGRTIRRWEDEGPSGPGGVALELLDYCLGCDGGINIVERVMSRALDAGSTQPRSA